jgi:hypothetical protein
VRFWLGIIGDTGTNKWTFYPGALPSGFSITGLPQYGFYITTQRTDGAVHFTVCPQRAFFVNGTLTDPGTTNVTVNFGKSVGTVNVYDPCTASDAYGGPNASQTVATVTNPATWRAAPQKPAPISTYSNVSSITLPLHLGPMVVEVMP